MDANPGNDARRRRRDESVMKTNGPTRTAPAEQASTTEGDSRREFIRQPNDFEASHMGGRADRYHVCIYFLPEAKDAVARRVWFEDQHFVVHENRLVELSFEVESLEGLDRWVLGWGSAAVVMKPEILRKRVVDAAQAVFEKHAV